MKKKIKQFSRTTLGAVVFSVIASLLVGGIILAATYNFYGTTNFNQSPEGNNGNLGGNLTNPGMTQDASAPVSVLNNAIYYDLDVVNRFAVDGATSISTFTQGGGVFATSSTGAVLPLVASDFDTENMIDVTLNIVDGTLSFPATTTLTSFIPNAGDTRTLYIRNATTTATMDLTIAGGTGVLLKQATSTSVTIPGDTDGGNFGVLRLIRKVNTDIELLVQVFKD